MTLNEKDKFEKKVKRNYTEATVYLKNILVMYKGTLKNTENAEKWWEAKIERTWKRRRYYSN